MKCRSYRGNAFQTGGLVDTIAEQVITLDHDVADVEPNANVHLLVFGQLGVTNRPIPLEW